MFSNNIKTQAQAPYWDDFQNNVEALDKNYIKILFRPGRSVQARELTQMQTILQSQINKFGKSVYKEGTAVIDGQCTIDNSIIWIKVSSGITSDVAQALVTSQSTLTDANGVIASVIGAANISGVIYLYIKYIKSALATNIFASGSTISGAYTNVASALVSSVTIILDSTATYTGKASQINVNRGVYFVAGSFVENTPQSTYVHYTSILDDLMTGYAVFNVVQTIVDYTTDLRLLDNSSGSNNYNAPGADRHKIELNLGFKSTAEWAALSNSAHEFIQLLTITKGKVFIAQRTEYSKLDDLLAQRTHEESGNYTIRPFVLDIREQSKALDPARGISTAPAAADNFVVGIEPSVAYVDGYRIELLERKDIVVAKKNTYDLKTLAAAAFTINYGSYIIGTILGASTTKLPNIVKRNAVYAFLTDVSAINAASINNLIGQCQIISVEYNDAATVRVFISDLKFELNKTLGQAKYLRLVSLAANGGSFTVDNETFTLSNSSGFVQYDSDLSRAVFPLPYTGVKSLKNGSDPTSPIAITRSVRIRLTSAITGITTSGSSGTSTLQTISAPAGTIFTSTTAADYIVFNTSTYTQANVQSVTLLTNGTALNLTLVKGSSDQTGNNIDVITHISETITDYNNPRTKTLTATYDDFYVTSIGSSPIVYSINNADSPDLSKITLSKADVVKITKIEILDVTLNPVAFVSVSDLSAYYLDNGQRDTHYTFASVKNIRDYATMVRGTRIHYLYFQHNTTGTNITGGYFIADSYSGTQTATSNGITYAATDLIPSYNGYKLSDCIDFRRSAATLLSSTAAQLEPNSTIITAVNFYMPRIDMVVVNKNAEFSVIRGNPAIRPEVPAAPVHTMPLYTLNIPGNLTSVKDISPLLIDNQRYTMRDIGELETRISNLEYYASLSLLETQTSQKSILNSTGGERFKNGFFADGFIGSNMGNVTYPGYLCAIDHDNQILRPFYTMTNSNVVVQKNIYNNNTIGTNLKLHDNGIMTLNYTNVTLINQPYASSTVNVNPYNVFTWRGAIELSPSSDDWMDTVRRADIVINNSAAYDAAVAVLTAMGTLGTVWQAWESKVWSTSKTAKHAVYNPAVGYKMRQYISTASTATRKGIVKSLGFTETTTAVDKTIEAAIIPFIRSREVYFQANLLKPNTQLYAFFDNVDITSYTRKKLIFNRFSASTTGVKLYTDAVNSNANSVNDAASPTILTTDSNGSIIGSFIIPNTTSLQFKTGERIFKLCDNTNVNAKDITTSAQVIYNSSGAMQTVQKQITSTRLSTGKIVNNNTSETGTNITVITWDDPVAQTFLIGDISTGCFITAVDLFFKTKDSSIPVTLHIVECENGTPTQNMIPGSKVIVESTSVSISIYATIETKFTFPNPLYLKSGIEYAMVIMSMSNNYTVWVAEIGEYDITNNQNKLISSNPYAGVFFMSQNASTWTADQSKDLKFKMYRAQFNTTATGNDNSATFRSVNSLDNVETATLLNLSSQELVFPETTLDWTLQFLVNSSNANPFAIKSNENYQLATKRSFSNIAASNTAIDYGIFNATFRTTSDYISPVLDLDRLSLTKIQNYINLLNYSGDGTNRGLNDTGIYSAWSKYITPNIELTNPADQLNIYMSISLPRYSDVQVYAKLRTSTVPINDIPWERVNLIGGTTIPVTDDQGEFNDAHFAILDTDISGITARRFSSFMIKIEMLADEASTTLTPLIKDLRIIATT